MGGGVELGGTENIGTVGSGTMLQGGLLETSEAGARREETDSNGVFTGALSEPEAENVVLFSASVDNGNWFSSGINFSPGSNFIHVPIASSDRMTASSANGYITQDNGSASADNYIYAPYIKRVTGTGEIEITVDNGATWHGVTASIDSSNFTRVSAVSGSTNTSADVGIRIVDSGDAIDVAAHHAQTGKFISSYIPTTTVAVTRAADDINIDIIGLFAELTDVAFTFKFRHPNIATGGGGIISFKPNANGKALSFQYQFAPNEYALITKTTFGSSIVIDASENLIQVIINIDTSGNWEWFENNVSKDTVSNHDWLAVDVTSINIGRKFTDDTDGFTTMIDLHIYDNQLNAAERLLV